jgi:hypothetical protein
MKTALRALAVLGLAAAWHGFAYASPRPQSPEQATASSRTSGKPGTRTDGGVNRSHAPGAKHSTGRIAPSHAPRHEAPPDHNIRGTSEAAANIPPLDARKSMDSFANAPTARTGTANRAPQAGQSGGARSTSASLNNARHRGLNPPAIGGAADSRSANAGAINGTGMKRRP